MEKRYRDGCLHNIPCGFDILTNMSKRTFRIKSETLNTIKLLQRTAGITGQQGNSYPFWLPDNIQNERKAQAYIKKLMKM